MAIVLQRLQCVLEKNNPSMTDAVSITGYLNAAPEDSSVASKPIIFKLLVEEDASLVLEYSTLRMLLQNKLKAMKTAVDADQKQALEREIIPLVEEALQLSTLLDQKYCHYINDRPNLRKAHLENHQTRYQRWLHVHKDHVMEPVSRGSIHVEMPLADEIRMFFEGTNPYRLGALRMRRLLIALIPILNHFEQYGPWIRWLDGFAAPAFSYFNLLFFLPRLTLNAYTLGSHWIEHASMSPEERSLGGSVRFYAQWDRLWPQLTNDIGWGTNAALMFFVFTGALQPFGIYLGIASSLYDLLLSSLRGYEEVCRLGGLEQQYQLLHQQDPNNADVKAYLTLLQKRIHRERELLLLALTNFSVLFFVAILALPSFATLSPWVPVAGSALSVIMTLLNFCGRDYLKPAAATELDALLKCDLPEEAPVIQQSDESLIPQGNSRPFFFSDNLAGSSPNLRQRHASWPQLHTPISPVTITASLSNEGFFFEPDLNKPTLLKQLSRDASFFFRGIDAIPGPSVTL